MTTNRSTLITDLQSREIPVLDAGFVRLVDVMGTDASIVQAARQSYGKGTRPVSDDRTLIRYLMRHNHNTPFEMAEIAIQVKIPMDCWRQMVRHRSASIAEGEAGMWDEPSVNEYSTRYSEAIEDCQRTAPDAWRSQATGNKQGSGGTISEWPEGYRVEPNGDVILRGKYIDSRLMTFPSVDGDIGPGRYLSWEEGIFQEKSRRIYAERLRFGVAREQARKDLPLSTYTVATWKCDLRNVLHFLALRLDSHAQQEIRSYARVIADEIVKPLFPLLWEAFEDYVLGAVTLTRMEASLVPTFASWDQDRGVSPDAHFGEYMPAEWLPFSKRSRERDECVDKMDRLGLICGEGLRRWVES